LSRKAISRKNQTADKSYSGQSFKKSNQIFQCSRKPTVTRSISLKTVQFLTGTKYLKGLKPETLPDGPFKIFLTDPSDIFSIDRLCAELFRKVDFAPISLVSLAACDIYPKQPPDSLVQQSAGCVGVEGKLAGINYKITSPFRGSSIVHGDYC